MELHEQKIDVKGILCYTVKTFALLTKHSEQSIRDLITNGNYIRKIDVVYFADRAFIPITELTTFPFTEIGRPTKDGQKKTYHFSAKGDMK